MKKNWILFILICGVAYAWMFYRQINEQREYERKMEEYKVAMVAYEEQVAEAERLKEEARRRIEETKNELIRQAQEEAAVNGTTSDGAAPDVAAITPRLEASEAFQELKQFLTIHDAESHVVETPLYRVVLSELGGKPISWEIKSSEFVTNVPEVRISPSAELDPEDVTVQLIPQTASVDSREFPLEFAGSGARDFNNELYTVEREQLDGKQRLRFTSTPVNGMRAIKDYVFHEQEYLVDLTVTFENGEETRKRLGREQGFGIGWQGGFGDPEVVDRTNWGVSRTIATGGKIRYNTMSRGDAADVFTGVVDWAGQEKKFFAALLIPSPTSAPIQSVKTTVDPRNFTEEYMRTGAGAPMSLELLHESAELELGQSLSLSYQIYAGPKNLEALSLPDYNLTAMAVEPAALVFHQVPLGMSFIRPLSLMMLRLMRWLHDLLGAWGLAIIATTIVVRIVIYPLTHWAIKNQARTMIEQQKIRPEMEAITKKYKSDPMKRNQAVMQLYRDHNVNPLGMFRGCVPILLQMPVLLALYVVFAQSVELRGQNFLWITDLSGPDRLFDWGVSLPLLGSSFNVLPILMAVTNYIQMRIMRMPATDELQERIQRQMTIMMPIMFIFFLYTLPSGLILYWIVSNCVSILQSIMTKRIIAKHMAQHEAEKAAANPTKEDKSSNLSGRAVTNNS